MHVPELSGKNSMKKTFRLHPPLFEDLGTTIVRIESGQMNDLGIKPGDAVKITGTKSTGAICLPVDTGYKSPNDSDIVYLSQSKILPQARASDLVANNIFGIGGGLVQVEIEKIPSINAEKVCIASLDGMPCDSKVSQNNILGFVVCKNNRFYCNNLSAEKNFAILITDVTPDDYCIITKDTQLEFLKNIPSEITRSWTVPKLGDIKKVIPVAHRLQSEFVNLTLPSLEIYDEGMRFYLYQRVTCGDKMEFSMGHPEFSGITLHDDIGNSYELSRFGGGGTTTGNEFQFEWSFVTSVPHSNAKELTMTIQEIMIQSRFSPPSLSTGDMGTSFLYPGKMKFPSFLIISGPWQIKIKL